MGLLSFNTREHLDQQDWEGIVLRLSYYALGRVRQRWWYLHKGVQAELKKIVEDVVLSAIAKVYKGEQLWDPIKHPDPLEFLIMVVRTEIHEYGLRLSDPDAVSLESVLNAYVFDPGPLSDELQASVGQFYNGFRDELKAHADVDRFWERMLASEPADVSGQDGTDGNPAALMNDLKEKFQDFSCCRNGKVEVPV